MNAWQPLISGGVSAPLPLSVPLHQGGVTTAALALCDHLAVIRATGEEAGAYLQGQLTCDLVDIDAGSHHAALHLSLKGRGLVSLRLAKSGNGYLLVCPARQVTETIACLLKYRLRAKVDFQVADDVLVAQLAGELAGTLAAAGLPLPEPGRVGIGDGVGVGGKMAVWRYPHSEQALLIGNAAAFEASWPALIGQRTVTDGDGARYQDVLAGEALLYPGAEDLFLPQVLNYDVLGGVSFRKGCYTGQEVVARMHFKGKLKQRMMAFAHKGAVLTPGEAVRNEVGRAVGEVVDGAPSELGAVALIVVRLDHQGDLCHDDQPLQVERLVLPYSLPEPKAS